MPAMLLVCSSELARMFFAKIHSIRASLGPHIAKAKKRRGQGPLLHLLGEVCVTPRRTLIRV